VQNATGSTQKFRTTLFVYCVTNLSVS